MSDTTTSRGWLVPIVGLLAITIPGSREPTATYSLGAELRAAMRPVVLLCYANLCVPLIAFFAVLSYAVPLLTDTGGLPLALVPLILLATGVASFLGSLLGGRLADWNPVATLIGVTAIDTLLFILLSQVASIGWAVAVLLCVIWLVSFALPPSLQSWALREASDAPNLTTTMMNTASQIGIALGAAFGGFVITQGWGYGQIPLLSAVFWAIGLVGILVLTSYDRRRKLAPASA